MYRMNRIAEAVNILAILCILCILLRSCSSSERHRVT